MKPMVQRKRYLKRKKEVGARIEAEKIFESMFTGQENNSHLWALQEQLLDLGGEPPSSLIERPLESEMGQLQGDFSNLLKVVIQNKPHEQLLSSILQMSSDSRAEEKLFQKNLSQIAERLERNYAYYKDLVDPVLGFIYSLKLGLGIAAIDIQQPDLTPLLTVPILGGELWLEESEKRSEIQILWLYQFATRRAVEGLDKKSYTYANNILHHFFESWKMDTTREKEQALTDASLYRYKGEEEDHDEREFRAMFPDYEQEPGHTIVTPDHRSLASQIARCHSAIYFSMESTACNLPSFIKRGVSVFISTLQSGAEFSASQIVREFLPAIALSLDETFRWINGRGENLSSKTYDFYTDENLEQALKLVDIVDRCQAHLRFLIEEWPENVTLQDALETCHELLNFSNDSPVAKLLPKVERLHESLNEWQSVASLQYSVGEHYDALTRLIISWRRLELATWPRLFDIEDEKCKLAADSWWFFLYESVVANPIQLSREGESLGNHTYQLLSTLISFITSSSVGQFLDRLHLLMTFERNVMVISDEFPGMRLVQIGLHNLIAYFSQYEPICKDFLMMQRKGLERQVAEVVLLASWKDTNILALRDSAKRSHHKLYKVVKKYRQILAQPMQPLIDGGMPSEQSKTVGSPAESSELFLSPKINFELAWEIYENQIQKWNNRPPRFADLATTVSTMKRISQSDKIDASDWLDNFSCSIVSIVQELQSETPKALLESNKNQVQHLKTRKRKAFTDTLKELRNMGLKSNVNSSTLQKQATLEAVLLATQPIEVGSSGNAAHYFLRVLELLPKIRRSASEPTPDLTGAEVSRSVGYIEDLFSMALYQQTSILSALKDLQHLRKSMDQYKTLSNLTPEHPDLYGSDTISSGDFADTRRKLLWLPETLGLAIELLRIHSDFSGIRFPNAETFLRDSRQSVVQTNTYLTTQTPVHNDFWEYSTKSFVAEAQGFLRDMNSRVNELRKEHPEIEYIITMVAPLVSPAIRTPAPRAPAKEPQVLSLGAIDCSLQGLCDLVLVTLQKLANARASYPLSSQHPGWLSQYQLACLSSIRALHIGDIARKTADSVALVAHLPQLDTDASRATRALFATYHPIIEEYTKICHKEVQEALSHHRAICKTTYILCKSAITLLAKGFCMPGEKSEESGEVGGASGGTGLGEGEGADDISKDIRADEDLSELAQERERDEGQQEVENEEDAVDIEDDLEGELGDAPEKGDDDENGSGSEDIDEEAGDVDDLDATAVDEKLWDAEGENVKDKKGSEINGNENLGEDLEAMKERREKERGREGKESEQDVQDSEGEEAEERDDVRPEATEDMDSHVPEVDTLDLPEDIELDGDEEGKGERGDDDSNMDALSDMEGGEYPQDEGKGESEEDFPELDAPVEDLGARESEDAERENESIGGEEGREGDEDAETNQADTAIDDQLLRTQKDEPKEPLKNAPSESQGLEMGNDQQNSNDQTSVQQQSGEEVKAGEPSGSSENDTQGQKLGQSAVQEEDTPQGEQPQKGDLPEEEQNSSFREVGDVLEKWHRSRRQIQDAKDDTDHPRQDNMVRMN